MSMIVSPRTFEVQVNAWKMSIEESRKRGDLAEANRKQEVLNRILDRDARFEGLPRSVIENKPSES